MRLRRSARTGPARRHERCVFERAEFQWLINAGAVSRAKEKASGFACRSITLATTKDLRTKTWRNFALNFKHKVRRSSGGAAAVSVLVLKLVAIVRNNETADIIRALVWRGAADGKIEGAIVDDVIRR